jgi:hypothetical protein
MAELSFALRKCGPDIEAHIVYVPGYKPFLRVFCGDQPSRRIDWDHKRGLFTWMTGPYEGLCAARRESIEHDAKEIADYVRRGGDM